MCLGTAVLGLRGKMLYDEINLEISGKQVANQFPLTSENVLVVQGAQERVNRLCFQHVALLHQRGKGIYTEQRCASFCLLLKHNHL